MQVNGTCNQHHVGVMSSSNQKYLITVKTRDVKFPRQAQDKTKNKLYLLNPETIPLPP
jgi:hypothetical protein